MSRMRMIQTLKKQRTQEVYASKEIALDKDGKLKDGYRYIKGGKIIKTGGQ